MQKEKKWSDDDFYTDVNYMFNKMSAWEGIHLFGERAVSGILKKYTQLYDMNVLSNVIPEELLIEEKKFLSYDHVNQIEEKQ